MWDILVNMVDKISIIFLVIGAVLAVILLGAAGVVKIMTLRKDRYERTIFSDAASYIGEKSDCCDHESCHDGERSSPTKNDHKERQNGKTERRKDVRRMFGRKNQNKEHKKIWKDRYERSIFPDPHGPFCKYFKNKLFHMSDYPMAYVAVIFTLFLLYVVIRYSLGWYYLAIASVSFAFSIWIFVSLWRM